jgi:hypothetical protein
LLREAYQMHMPINVIDTGGVLVSVFWRIPLIREAYTFYILPRGFVFKVA